MLPSASHSPGHFPGTWHGVENGFQRRAGISAANDGGVRRLAILNQLLTCCLLGLGTPGTAIHEATVAVLAMGSLIILRVASVASSSTPLL